MWVTVQSHGASGQNGPKLGKTYLYSFGAEVKLQHLLLNIGCKLE